jgi:hypothetical protein
MWKLLLQRHNESNRYILDHCYEKLSAIWSQSCHWWKKLWNLYRTCFILCHLFHKLPDWILPRQSRVFTDLLRCRECISQSIHLHFLSSYSCNKFSSDLLLCFNLLQNYSSIQLFYYWYWSINSLNDCLRLSWYRNKEYSWIELLLPILSIANSHFKLRSWNKIHNNSLMDLECKSIARLHLESLFKIIGSKNS